MRIFITGAAGFIGSTLVDRLLAEGHQVVGVDNLSTGFVANLENALHMSERFTFVQNDIQAPELKDLIAGTNPNVIFHLAAQVDPRASMSDPQFDARSNVLGTINLCEASRRAGVRRIVYAASGESRYGAAAPIPVAETDEAVGLSPNAVAKLAGEMYLRAYAEMYGLTPICLALASVYGPRQWPHGATGVIEGLCRAMVTGQPLTVYRDGIVAHDYVYVDDVVEAFIRAACAPMETTGTYNIGTGQPSTATEVRELIAAELDGSSAPSCPFALSDGVHAIALDSTKAHKELGWMPTVDLREGIHHTIRWLCDYLEPEPPALVGACIGASMYNPNDILGQDAPFAPQSASASMASPPADFFRAIPDQETR